MRLVRKSRARNSPSSPLASSPPRSGSRVFRSAASPSGPTSRPNPPAAPSRTGRLEYAYGALPPEHAVINRSDRRRGEAQEETVERAVVEPAPPRQTHLQIRRAVEPAAVKMTKRQPVANSTANAGAERERAASASRQNRVPRSPARSVRRATPPRSWSPSRRAR